VTAIVTGLLFIVALFVAPLVGAIPSAATAPALIIVGSLMLSSIGEIDWTNALTAVPAFLTLITIPLTFSIANGLAFGVVSYVLLRVARGRFREISLAAYVMAALLIVRFIYMGQNH
jgi:AGZA family xanthine/uracil permease-like MFS transporter